MKNKKPKLAMSPLRLIKWCAQWRPKDEWARVPVELRGIYVLHHRKDRSQAYNVVYVGMATSGKGIRRRLGSHAHSRRKSNKWTHFSFFVVWENIRNDEISELEALFREIYRKDKVANSLNKQKRSKRIRQVRRQPKHWVAQD